MNGWARRAYASRLCCMEYRDYQKLLQQLMRLEGRRLGPYRDSDGRFIPARREYMEAAGLDHRESVTVLEADARGIARELDQRWPCFRTLDPVRQRVLVHMALNTTVVGLLSLRKLIEAIEAGYWLVAAHEMLMSKWAARDTERGTALAEMMRRGSDETLSRRSKGQTVETEIGPRRT